ncbi:PREDICTED: paired amphipathic helix protein Sin3-like 1 [Camelina sativa]|uniref:Paired amphipathic helix protein Sin3-like 1 n=1 Tax=Camelina sativa TaxID=90675 RepID=A0ABM1QD33_CAMSA|nr:PREDICTED: paired amphipathic helix protein Sin3-like 1 [Camelina sativa]XP_019084671.1 PREDICTED: paired amphipathic helix protein Sin3-like 1 [Camelina sativa]
MSRTGDSSVTSNVQPVRTNTHSAAMSFLLEVRETFRDQRDKFETFLKIVKEWSKGMRDRPNYATLVARVKQLFNGHNNLIIGFNTFLLPEYQIPLEDADDSEEECSVISTARDY